ncbi:MAG: outer membrane protein assembly factor BamE, partial [Azovibrio sp.]|nr:outer membrane protein assembly factor BamE [Azovibrio sp.]
LVLAALLGAFVWWSSVGVFSTEKFDPAKWHAPVSDAQDVTCYRGGMATDIRDKFLVHGETKQFVERLLGKPDFATTGEYRYILGMCSGFRMDYDDLHIYFDNQGRVTGPAIIQH